MANIHTHDNPEDNFPKPYLQSRRGGGMPGCFCWNIGRGEDYRKGFNKAFGHSEDEFIGGRNRKEVKECKDTECEWYSDRKRSGCVQYDDAKECKKKPWELANSHGELPGDICCQRATGKYCFEHNPDNYV